MARPSPSCAHDDDRLRLPAASPSRSNSAEKKESTDPRLSQLCPPYVTPSSSSSLEYHRSDARIVENGFAAGSGMSNSAKVGLEPATQKRKSERNSRVGGNRCNSPPCTGLSRAQGCPSSTGSLRSPRSPCKSGHSRTRSLEFPQP